MPEEIVKTEGRLAVGKARRGRPKSCGMILQVLSDNSISNCIVPIALYRKLEDTVIKYMRGSIPSHEASEHIFEYLNSHMYSGGIIEVYNKFDTTTTDMRKYRVLEILHLPSTFGCISLVPGLGIQATHKINQFTGEIRTVACKNTATTKALEHTNPDRRS